MYARVFVENLYKIYISEYKLLQDKLFVWELKKNQLKCCMTIFRNTIVNNKFTVTL